MRATAIGDVGRRLALFAAILCAVPIALEFWHEHEQRTDRIQQTEAASLNVARAVAREADATFELAGTILFGIVERLQNGGRSQEALGHLSRSMALAVRNIRTLNGLFVYDEDGRWIASSLEQIPPDVNNADRAYFQFHRSNPSPALRLSEPIRSRYSGKWIILVSRRLEQPDGSFAGVAAAAVNVEHFVDRFSGFDIGSNGTIALLTPEGKILARRPYADAQIGRDLSAGPLFRKDLPQRPAGVGRYISPIDGAARIAGYATASVFPVVAYVAISEDEALASWRAGALARAAVLVVMLAALAALGLRLLRDVRRRAQVEVDLADSEARYRLLSETATDMITLMDAGGQRLYVSPAARDLMGYEPHELVGTSPLIFIHPDDVAGHIAFIQALAAGRQDKDVRVNRVRHKDGRWIWVEGSVRCLRDRDGHVTGFVSAVRDIGERKAADEALRASEGRYRLLSEAATDMVTQMDLSGQRLYVSPGSRDLLGYEPHELLSTSPQQTIHPDDADGLATLLGDLTAGRRERGVNVNRLRHRDGRWVWVEASLRRLQDGTGRTTGFVASVRNIEARKADETALLAARKEAERASAAKSEFLAAMSHEIRTPLNAVIGFADLLAGDPQLGPRQRQHTDRIRNAGAALLTVVNDILDFSKVEAEAMTIHPRPFSPAQLIDNAVSIVRPFAERKGLTLAVGLDPDVPVLLMGDEDRLRQVLLNLLNNAVKFTERGGVTLAVTREAEAPGACGLHTRVSDTGAGIATDQLDRLFQRFSQVDGTHARGHGGTGLGLAISKRLVELMGGRIGVESREGVGSTFWFSLDLPVADVAAGEGTTSASASGAQTGGRPLRLLLVDDLDLNRELAGLVLEGAGHRVEFAANGWEAVRVAAEGRHDLILMDMQMPGMDGLEAARRIRRLDTAAARVPILAMTANILPEQIAACRAAGMDGHVGKPFRRDELLDAIARAADRAAIPDALPAEATGGPVLNQTVLHELVDLLGREHVGRLLAKLQRHLQECFGGQPGSLSPDRLAADAHATAAAAGQLGFEQLSDLCRRLERACREAVSDVADLEAQVWAARDRARPLIEQARRTALAA